MYTIAAIISFFGHLIIGLIVYFKNKKSEINQLFFVFTIILSLYILTTYLSLTLNNQDISKMSYFIAQLTYAAGFAWILSLCKGSNPKRSIIILLIGGFLGILTLFDNFAIKEIKNLSPDNLEIIAGNYSWIFIVYALTIFIIGTVFLIRAIAKEKGTIRKKLFTIASGLILFALLTILSGVILPAFGIYQLYYLDILWSLVFIGSAAYAMIMDKS